MNLTYIIDPKNPNLKHCSNMFYKAFLLNNQLIENESIQQIKQTTFKELLLFIKVLLNVDKNSKVFIFFFAPQAEYLILVFLLRVLKIVFPDHLKICYLMHEPRLEKGRVNSIKTSLVYTYQLLFSYFADKILLPSDQAVAQAKTFVQEQKIYKVNLPFNSIPKEILKDNLEQLKCCWETCKAFSMIATVSSSDKNPWGFLNFANIFNQYYSQKAQFIRAGLDRGVHVNYDENTIIRFPSYLSNSAKSFLLGLTHFVVIPYSTSTQSGVIAEALSYGKLLIVNDIPAFSYLKSFSFAFVVDFNNEGSILKCIHDLLSMDANDYESRYWKAVDYFHANHSEGYLAKTLSNIL